MTAGHDPTEAQPAGEPRRSRARLLVGLVLSVLVLATAWARVHVALADPQFDPRDPAGMLKSDPALLHHLVERMAEAGGAIPADFARDTALEHPDTIDVAERFPLGHLLVVAWIQAHLAGDTPLHVTALWTAALSMGLGLVGVYLLARELSGSARLALLAALLAAATPAFHRSVGFVLVDEDWFWPLFVLHLGLVARAVRVRSAGSVVIAALAAAAALATWHAAGFFLALEAVVALGWLLWTGRSPLALRGGAAVPLVLAVAAVVVPFLREVGAAFSFPVAAAAGSWLAARTAPGRAARVVGTASTLGLASIGPWIAGGAAYAHVFALFAAKLEHWGIRPETAHGLSPDVRLMWQGPFATPSFAHAAQALSLSGAVALVAAVRACSARERAARSPATALAALFALSIGGAWFAERALVLPALLGPALAAWAAARVRNGPWILGAIAAVQVVLCGAWAASYVNPWYHAPVQRQAEIRWMVETVERVVPRGEAVAADFMSSTAILARSGNPICISPKWEAAEPRRRAAEFLDAFHHRSPAEFRALILERYRARWLVVDRFTLQYLARWSADLPAGSFEPLPGTAAAALLSQDDASLRSIPGYELVARSPSTIRQSNGLPTDFYRIFRLDEGR